MNTNGIELAPRTGAVLIAGPTASGKSYIAVELARRHDGIVVNADSMQVYAELRILTARPSAEDEATAPHRLYGHVPAAQRYSVGRWLEDVKTVLDAAQAEGRPAILVGGTGLYFKALTEGLAAVPPVPDDVRQEVLSLAEGEDSEMLHRRLAESDPEDAAAIRPSDRARILRAMEVFEATGRSLSAWQSRPAKPLLEGLAAQRILLNPDRETIHQRIAERADRMIHEGAVEEVRALTELGLAPELPAMKAIGVREICEHLHGDTSLDEMLAGLKTETRRYAKRQVTWFRNQMPDWPRQ